MSSGRYVEQADGRSKRAGGYHQYIKKQKHRAERHAARKALRNLEEPQNGYGKYKGWEM